MNSFLIYILKSTLCITLLYLLFRIILRKESYFALNRIMLLSIVVSSVVIPLLYLPEAIQSPVQVDLLPVFAPVETQIGAIPATNLESPASIEKSVAGESIPDNAHQNRTFSKQQLLQYLYLAGFLFTLLLLLHGLFTLFSLFRRTNLATGKSNLIIDCHIPKGNPSDQTLFAPALDRVIENYGIIPRDSSTDSGYASKENSNYCVSKDLVNIVFNKVVGSLQNIATSLKMETILKKWRSGIEGVISNLKRGFDLRVCAWKGFKHFKAKVMWSVLAYNFRVLTNMTLHRIAETA